LPPNEIPNAIKSELLSRLEMTEKWREEAILYILSCSVLYGASYSTAEFNAKERQFPFLKKAPVAGGGKSADITLAILNDLGGETGAVFSAEALLLKNAKKS
jgi:hypothetical protein